jgi:cellulose synthase (UDP-forming)
VYIFNPVHAGNPYLYTLQVLADAITITLVSTLWITILLDIIQPEYHKRDILYNKDWTSLQKPTVDVLIPVFNEPVELVEKTIEKAAKLDYAHQTYILDDGNSSEVKALSEKYHVHYSARPSHGKKFAKSGNLNYGLHKSTADFFVVFDADHAPKKNFIIEVLPFFENLQVALVQTPQYFTNTDKFIASGTAQAQEVFYNYVQAAKNSYNAAFCVGTNMMYRRSAINAIGGISLRDHSEDIWTTLLLHEKGFESIFYNKVLAHGRAPETIQSFFRQQNRWAQGGLSLLFTHNPLFSKGLNTDQKLQYFFSNIHYFSAFPILIYLCLPILYLLFNIHPVDIEHDSGWIIHYIPYFATVFFLPLFLQGSLKLSTISTSLASFYPYLTALMATIFKSKHTWISTESKQVTIVFMKDIWLHMFLIILSFLAILIGWYQPTNLATTIVTSIWVFLNAYFLFLFIRNGIIQK